MQEILKTDTPERNRTTSDILKHKKTCPEETIYQIGTLDNHVSPELLLQVVTEFMSELSERFGSHIHILDWHSIWMKAPHIFMNAMYLTVKISMGNYFHNRKKPWNSWDLNYQIRINLPDEPITEK